MGIIYHVVTIWFILYSIGWVLNTKNKLDNITKIKDIIKEYNDMGLTVSNYSKEDRDKVIAFLLPSFIVVIWSLIGLLTYNWVLFILLILFNVLIIRPIDDLLKKKI